jgi:Bystin
MQAQRFVNIVLLPHVRRDIRDNRRLHFALFQSLKKACYKPDAFYKVAGPHLPSAAHLSRCSCVVLEASLPIFP